MATADKMLRNYLDVLEELIRQFDYEVQIRHPRGRSRSIRLSIGRQGEEWATGEGSTLAVALKRSLKQLLDDVEEDMDLAEVSPERHDALTFLLAGVV